MSELKSRANHEHHPGLLHGVFSKRYVEVHGGKLTWAKPNTLVENVDVSVRDLAGCSVHMLEKDNKIVKTQKGLFIFVVYLAANPKEVHVPPLIFATESEAELETWMSTIRLASSWQFHRPSLQPHPPRLSGVVLVEIISVDNVRIADWGGKSDPYVVVEHNGLRTRSTTHHDALSTVFNELLTLPVYQDQPNIPINITVYDEDAFHSDDLLGEVSIPLHSLGFNVERYWDSVSLKLLSVRPPPVTRGTSAIGSDPFGTISLRTYYRSSRVTQFLPMDQRPTIFHPSLGDANSMDVSLVSLDEPVVTVSPKRRASVTWEKDQVQSAGFPGSPTSLPSSPGSAASSASPKLRKRNDTKQTVDESLSGEGKAASLPRHPLEYDFSVEMMKLQLNRLVRIVKYLRGLKSFVYFIQWRDPAWTVLMYAWVSWISLIEPQSFLMFYYALFGKWLIQAHPSYPELVDEVGLLVGWCRHRVERSLRMLFGFWIWEKTSMVRQSSTAGVSKWTNSASRSIIGLEQALGKLGMDATSVGGVSPGGSLVRSGGGVSFEFRVYECQRRKIATATKFLTTFVKAPVSVASAAASPLIHVVGEAVGVGGSDDKDSRNQNKLSDPDEGTNTPIDRLSPSSAAAANFVDSVQEVGRDFKDLFVHFSASNLKHGKEAEWVGPSGVPLIESPATIMNGIKIKWTVHVDPKTTDLNGWEFSRKLPDLVEGSTAISDQSILVNKSRKSVWTNQSISYSPSFKIHKHWTRRRVWVGVPVRIAFDSEDPILLSEIVASTNGREDQVHEDVITSKESRGLFAKYKQLMEEGKKLQMSIFGIASKIESIKNLFSWKVRWISTMIYWLNVILLMLTLVMPPAAVLWLILTLVLLDQYTDCQQKLRLMQPFFVALQAEIQTAQSVPEGWKKALSKKLASPYTKMEELLTDFSGTVILTILQRTCVSLGMHLVKLTLADLKDEEAGGKVTLAMLFEKIYERANNGNEDWWKTVKTCVHPKNLIKDHLVSDWEEFNPVSVFSAKRD